MARKQKGLPTPRSVRSPYSPTPPSRQSLRKRLRLSRSIQQGRRTVHSNRRFKREFSQVIDTKPLPDQAIMKALAEAAAPLFRAQSDDILRLSETSGRQGSGTTPAELARMAIAYVAHTALGWRPTRVGEAIGRTRYAARHACMTVEDLRDDPAFDRRIAVLEAAAAVIAADFSA